jgi:hypothetical protein
MNRKTDKGIIREYLKNGIPFAGEPLVIKQYLYTEEGDPTQGIAKTFAWSNINDFGVITGIEQNDVLYSGGIYQLGDIKVQLMRELKPIDDATQHPGDRIVWRGHEYKIVGRISTNYLEGYVLYDYVFRRI